MEDYLAKYMNDDGLDLLSLFNDDYIHSFKLLWNNHRYVSAAKLLFSFVDTLAFIEFGDSPKNFQRWLDTYADLPSIHVDSDQLWELRNSLLHMTNANSRKVIRGNVPRTMFYVGQIQISPDFGEDGTKWFNLWDFFLQLTDACVTYCKSFQNNPAKFSTFIERYDSVISDCRYMVVNIDELPTEIK
ncbi:MAG: hypothetical protein AAGH99_11675 [Planctomycetota bacterium]